MPNPLRLRPIDLGFDPRVHDMRVVVDMDYEYDGCTYSRRDGQPDSVPTWDAALIGVIATREGYRLAWRWPSKQLRLREWSSRITVLRQGEPVLEMRDPNDTTGARYQYLAQGGVLKSRRLPRRGERWNDEPGPPWWEPVAIGALRAPHLVLDWLAACGRTLQPWQYVMSTEHIVAWTPSGREVRYDPNGGVVVQPPNDTYWQRCANLAEARAVWYRS